jgi:hypothetical protein
MRLKRLLFIPYAATIVGPAIESIVVAIRRSCPIALIHAPLAFFVAMDILFQMMLKCLGIRPRLTTYGGREELPTASAVKTP